LDQFEILAKSTLLLDKKQQQSLGTTYMC